MTGALLLAAYAAATGFAAPAALRRGWAARAPRLAMALWLALPASWLVAVAVAAVAVSAPSALGWPGARRAAGPDLTTSGAGPGSTAVAVASLLLAAVVLARAGWCIASGLAGSRRQRRGHAAFLAAAGRPDPALGAIILDDPAPAAYSVAAGRHRIAVSAGALAVLDPAQLQAVLAHERAHLRGRHHLIVAGAAALGRAFPQVPLLSQAAAQVGALAEMAADDSAAHRHDPADLAAALVILARAQASAAVLAVGGPAALARVQRLVAPPRRPGRTARAALLAAGAAALSLPAVIACLPLAAVACGAAGQT